MENKKARLSTLIAVSLFVAVFGALLAIATVFDWKISTILTKSSLPTGQYFSTNGFGLFFEAVGSAPIYLMAAVAGAIAFWWGFHKTHKIAKVLAPVIATVVVVVAIYMFVNDIFKYVGEHMHNEAYMSKGYVQILVLLLSCMMGGLLLLAWRNIKQETNDKLIQWVLVILVAVACYLLIHFIKGPMGRMRFRAIHYMGVGQDGFTPWYVVNGARNVLPIANGVEISDSCKSFPSGHTFSAALVYTLLCLPDILKSWNKRWVKILLYVLTIGFTGAVAISRIVVGAHFMSDVLFGGTMSFLAMVIGREIFLFKGAHLTVFGKKKSEKVAA